MIRIILTAVVVLAAAAVYELNTGDTLAKRAGPGFVRITSETKAKVCREIGGDMHATR